MKVKELANILSQHEPSQEVKVLVTLGSKAKLIMGLDAILQPIVAAADYEGVLELEIRFDIETVGISGLN